MATVCSSYPAISLDNSTFSTLWGGSLTHLKKAVGRITEPGRRQRKRRVLMRASSEKESEEGVGTGGRGGTEATAAALLSKDRSAVPDAAASTVLQGLFDVQAASADDNVDASMPNVSAELAAIYASCRWWSWRGYRINYVVQGTGNSLLLVHGFGASVGHWRRNIGILAQSNRVYAIDLLGLGASEKPPKFKYTMETWAEMLLDFTREVINEPTVLIGNSIGSLACTIVAAGKLFIGCLFNFPKICLLCCPSISLTISSI